MCTEESCFDRMGHIWDPKFMNPFRYFAHRCNYRKHCSWHSGQWIKMVFFPILTFLGKRLTSWKLAQEKTTKQQYQNQLKRLKYWLNHKTPAQDKSRLFKVHNTKKLIRKEKHKNILVLHLHTLEWLLAMLVYSADYPQALLSVVTGLHLIETLEPVWAELMTWA